MRKQIQIALLLTDSVVTLWFLLKIPSWSPLTDPCLHAMLASAAVTAFLWLALWRPAWIEQERRLLAVFLAGMPLIYVARYVRAGGSYSGLFWMEVLAVPVFAGLALLGLKRTPWFLAVGIVLHGIGWDAWHYHNSFYIPNWYSAACLAVDLCLGAYAAARIPEYRRASAV